jgi:hypothetical protein
MTGLASGTPIGGSARRLTDTDTTTGVHADVVLESKPWGTLVSFGVSDISGPRNCRLVAVRTDGKSEVLSSWTVPQQGYGKNTRPRELTLQAATATTRQDIAALQVQDVSPKGAAATLVTVRS